MGAEWDTLGWIYFKQGDMAKAEKYVDASWQLSSRVTVADHLGQIYEEQGRHEAALQMWRLVSATNGNHEDAQQRLRSAGVPVSEPLTVLESAKSPPSTSPDEELEKLRTIAVPDVRYRTGGADLFLLLSKDGIEDVQSIDTSADFKDAAHSIRMAPYKFPFPDAGPEKIIRSGILSCSVDRTPSCQVTVLPVLSTPLPAKQLPAKDPASDGGASASYIFPPTLRVKVEPRYSEAAKNARLEGSVLLSIVINEDGIPRNISVVKSLGMGLDENAKECVAKWRFNPATKDGKPVASLANVQVNFVLIEGPQ
jgi:TonB family protein